MGDDYVFDIRIVHVVPIRQRMPDNSGRYDHYAGLYIQFRFNAKMKLDYFGYDCGRNGIKFWTAFFLSLLSLVSLVENDTKKEEKWKRNMPKPNLWE